MLGRVHSLETMGLVDGPGIRCVVFFQGCNLRCLYCHNPDTWSLEDGEEISAEELVQKVLKYKVYFQKSGGGVTCSGGEPLLQPEFLKGFLKLCKKNGLHTALDTAGCGLGEYEEILQFTDLVLLDIKHFTPEGFKNITGKGMQELLAFIEALNKSHSKVWLRHVVIPGLTDSREHIEGLKKFSVKINNIEKIELLPYHTLGTHKYEKKGIKYQLKGLEPMDKEKLKELQKLLNKI